MRFSQYKKEQLSDAEVLDIRKRVMAPEKTLRLDVEALISLNEHIKQPSAAWKTLFVEAISDYVLDENISGYVISDVKAKWLLDGLLQDHRLDMETEFRLLIKLINKANIVSKKLEVFILGSIKDAILKGEGQWAKERKLEAGRIGEDDVELLKRVFYAVGGEGGIDISRAEAEMIYDLSDATADADNHESWQALFSQMIACYMMAGMSAFEPDKDWAARRDTWVKSDKGLDFSMRNILTGYKTMLSSAAEGERSDGAADPYILDDELQKSLQRVTDEEAQWLIDRVNRDGRLTPDEAAMLYYIKQECPDMHYLLDEFITAMAYA